VVCLDWLIISRAMLVSSVRDITNGFTGIEFCTFEDVTVYAPHVIPA